MHLIFRVDTARGQGHISRCKALGEVWRGKGAPINWQEDEFFTIDPGSWFVFDGYDFTEKDHKETRQAGYRVLVIDDNAHLSRYDCDILVNHNAHAKSLKYKVNKDCKLLLGPEYALIRREFHEWRDRREPHEARRVLVALGSAANHAERSMVRRLLNEIECESRWAEGDAHLPSLMAWADVGILAAGVVSLEACYMGLPSILMVTAVNQAGNAFALDGLGCGYHLGPAECISKGELASALGWLLGDELTRRDMREQQMALVDGKGAQRVVEVMLGK